MSIERKFVRCQKKHIAATVAAVAVANARQYFIFVENHKIIKNTSIILKVHKIQGKTQDENKCE